jgi:hypothetical protein
MTSYQYAGNNPVMYNDPLGDLYRTPPNATPAYQDFQPNIHLKNGVYDKIEGDLEDSAQGAIDYGTSGGGNGDGGGSADYSSYWDKLAADNDLTINKGPSAFSLHDDGKLEFVTNIDGNQNMIYSDSGNIYSIDNSISKIELNQTGTYTASDGSVRNFSYLDIKVTGDKAADGLYDFLINNSKVEWSHLEYGTNKNMISTTFSTTSEKAGILNAILIARAGGLVRELDHNHPVAPPNSENYFGPSGFHPKDKWTALKGGDMNAIIPLVNYNYRFHPDNTIIFKVFEQTIGHIVQYTQDVTVK